MKRLGAMISAVLPSDEGPRRAAPRTRIEARVLETLELLLAPDMLRELAVSTRAMGHLVVLVGSPAVRERVQALLPVLETAGRSAIDGSAPFAVSCALAPGLVRGAPVPSAQAPASVEPLAVDPPGTDVTTVGATIANRAVRAAFEGWMATGLASRRRDKLA